MIETQFSIGPDGTIKVVLIADSIDDLLNYANEDLIVDLCEFDGAE